MKQERFRRRLRRAAAQFNVRRTDRRIGLQEFEIKPLEGVGPVQLGMMHAEVHQVLGEPVQVRDRRECFMEGFFVDFDSAGRVEFIELGSSPLFRATFHGACLHELPAEEVVAFVSRYGQFDEADRELGYSYVFLDLQLSLWRVTQPEPDQAPDDPDGRHFEAVGIGVHGYFTPGGA